MNIPVPLGLVIAVLGITILQEDQRHTVSYLDAPRAAQHQKDMETWTASAVS